MEFDSKEEQWFSWWLDELKERGYIFQYDRADSLALSEAHKELKLRAHEYTPDFSVCWNIGALKKLNLNIPTMYWVGEYGEWDLATIEVKPSFDAHNMTRLFKLNQKWVYQKYGIYVELVIPEKLFEKTFCPQRYLLTDGGKGLRKLKKSYLTVDEYINQHK